MKRIWSILKRYPFALSCLVLYISILSITSPEGVRSHFFIPILIPVFLAGVYILTEENARKPQPPLE